MKRTTAALSIAMLLATSLLAENKAEQPTKRQPHGEARPFEFNGALRQDYAKGRGRAQSTSDVDALRKTAVLGEAPPQFDVVGDHLTKKQEQLFVSRLTRLMGENWDSIDDAKKLKAYHAWLKHNLSCDPRLALAMGLVMEKHHKLDQALYWYEKSRNCRPAIPYFNASQRSILVRLKRKGSGDIDAALNESVELVKHVVQLARDHGHEMDDIDQVLAHNIFFVGRVLAYLEQPSDRKARRFLVNTGSDDNAIQAHLSRLPSGYDYLALYAMGKGELQDEYLARKNFEGEIEAENKREANAQNKREKQGEIENRMTVGPHEQAPNAFDYYEERGGGPYGTRRYLPPISRAPITKDKKWNDEWFKVIEPWYRKPPRRSEYIRSYFPMNLESERRKLLETFPDRYDGQRWSLSAG